MQGLLKLLLARRSYKINRTEAHRTEATVAATRPNEPGNGMAHRHICTRGIDNHPKSQPTHNNRRSHNTRNAWRSSTHRLGIVAANEKLTSRTEPNEREQQAHQAAVTVADNVWRHILIFLHES